MEVPLEDARSCLNFALRRTSRLVTQYYDRALSPTGLRATQFNLMIPLALRASFSISELAAAIGMDRSALARNLKPLERNGWVEVLVGTDRRTRIARLTPQGRRRLRQAFPLWRKAQQQLTGVFQPRELQALLDGLRITAGAASD